MLHTYTNRLDAAAVPNEIYERSHVALPKNNGPSSNHWHVAQRPISSGEEIKLIVYAIWNMADPTRTAEARAALKERDA